MSTMNSFPSNMLRLLEKGWALNLEIATRANEGSYKG